MNTKAKAVLAIFEDLCGENYTKDFYIEPYLNGRENGFAITEKTKT